MPLRLNSSPPNRVDCAIGALLDGIEYRAEICSIGPVTGTVTATDQMQVRKHGRTTGYTEGTITDVPYSADVGKNHNDPNVIASFSDQMRIEVATGFSAFGLGGDSGSLVVEAGSQNAVGLYFAGPEAGDYGIANQIANVLADLEIEIV